jgi:hypothetical protein
MDPVFDSLERMPNLYPSWGGDGEENCNFEMKATAQSSSERAGVEDEVWRSSGHPWGLNWRPGEHENNDVAHQYCF